MQRELTLDAEKPLADALSHAVQTMIDEAELQTRRAIDEPGVAMHQYRRALRRAEAVLQLALPMLRKEPRRWLERSFRRARRRTRIARDLDAVMPVVDRLEALALLDSGDPTLVSVRAWLEQCRSELASAEIVAWRLRKNARALAGLGAIFAAAMHGWVDLELVLESLRESYRDSRKRLRRAAATHELDDMHAWRRAVRRLRYQLELLASPRSPTADEARPEPSWLPQVRALHSAMKELGRELGHITNLLALRAIVGEAEGQGVGFDPERLAVILGELAQSRLERVLIDAELVFATPPKQLLSAEDTALAGDHATTLP